MFGRTMMIYFAAYFIANFIAVVFSSKIINDVHYDAVKLFFFTILITVFQFILEHFFKLNILYTIFVYPVIYMFVIYIFANVTKLIRIGGFGAAIKTALIMVFFQLCTKFAFQWKLAKIFNV
ncbi:MAG: hypothetical protein K5622_05775 [Endomicrobiaceae bacterium]|nr:hypothetical protein [Endomicrobiaceae bacterium]